MSALRVSLVIPCYNGAAYLAEALQFGQDPLPKR
jgi:hypothetical protein